jgi:glycosyltransferase involved in cell wall biosynthesis/GT2 family glycosyltransferase
VKSVAIGIHVHAEAARLRRTIAAVRTHTRADARLVLLPDGADADVIAALNDFPGLLWSGGPGSEGAPACFNRLIASADADVYVFLESGAIPAPRWLDYLLTALSADPRNGLAGPTTNMSWNEQGAVIALGDRDEAIAAAATEAAHRFGTTLRTLEPLHSLGDFCYAVRRDVVDAIGGADEGYGLGPCWEMDYNVRAARAGFRGVWAGAAYVYRSPFTARRAALEAQLFEASKRRYQDNFCGARLRGVKPGYRDHCRGDACPNFAPAAMIVLRQPLAAGAGNAELAAKPLTPDRQQVAALVEERDPSVTCIMPTRDRRRFVPQAIRSFLRQEYARSELLVLDDGVESLADCVPKHDRVHYVRCDAGLSLGAKRNLACSRARGDVIVHWDDDDWYPSWRIGVQVRALLASRADVCGTSRILYYQPATDRAWEYRYDVGDAPWVGGNTLAYRRQYWEKHPFPNLQVGEDAQFVWNSPPAAVSDLRDPRLCVGMVHDGNTSRKDVTGPFWYGRPSSEIHTLLGDDVHFYGTTRREGADPWPLVSCIMPTRDRRALVSLALKLFAQQDYPNRELVIVDDGDDAIADLAADVPGVEYVRLTARTSIGAKRNIACRRARGDLVAHWDDDDWYGPDRLRYQIAPIVRGDADITGLENAFVLDLAGGSYWTTTRELHRRMFVGDVHGGTLIYRKSLCSEGFTYPELNLAEDAWLVHLAVQRGKRLRRLANPAVFVYMRHARNAWKECVPGSFLAPAGWLRVGAPPGVPDDLITSYRVAAGIDSSLP